MVIIIVYHIKRGNVFHIFVIYQHQRAVSFLFTRPVRQSCRNTKTFIGGASHFVVVDIFDAEENRHRVLLHYYCCLDLSTDFFLHGKYRSLWVLRHFHHSLLSGHSIADLFTFFSFRNNDSLFPKTVLFVGSISIFV